MARSFLDTNNISYQDFDVASDKEARKEMVAKSGQMAVPAIEIDGEFIIGFDESALKEKLGIQ